MTTVTSNRTPSEQAALDLIRHRKQGYTNALNPEDRFASIVLADLARFCRANKSTFHENPQVQARLDGRREVFLRICDFLNMSESELYEALVKGNK